MTVKKCKNACHPEALAEGSQTNVITPTSKSKISVLPRGEDMSMHVILSDSEGSQTRFDKDSSVVSLPQNDCRKKKLAFTLAEVLITLGIIGVVAAMTIPNLMTAHQKKVTVTKLQKAISVLNQAYRLAYDDVGEATAEEAMAMGAEEYFKTYWAQYLKVETYCTDYKMCGYNSNTPFKYLDGTNSAMNLVFHKGRTTFYTSDGFLYVIMNKHGSADSDSGFATNSNIYVDINGGKGPNMFGKDVFVLTRMIDGEKGGSIVPYGYDKDSSIINRSCSKTSIGEYCAEKIKRAGWQIDRSYPW